MEYSNCSFTEVIQQQLYETKMKLERAVLINEEQQTEIERLHTLIDTLKEDIKVITERGKSEVLEWASKCNNLHTEFENEKSKREEAEVEIKELKKYLEKLRKDRIVDMDQTNEEYILKIEKAELEKMQEELKQSREVMRVLKCDNQELIGKVSHLEDNLKQTEESLRLRTERAENLSKLVEQLKQDKAIIRNELSLLKTESVDKKQQGNSLFGEVEDKMKDTMLKLKDLNFKYLQTKKKLLFKSKEIENLRLENLKIKNTHKQLNNEGIQSATHLINCYKERVKELCEMVRRHEEDRFELPKTTSGSEVLDMNKWMNAFINEAREKEKNLTLKLDEMSSKVLDREEKCYFLKLKVQEFQKKLSHQESCIEESKNTKTDYCSNMERHKTCVPAVRFAEYNGDEEQEDEPKANH